MIKQFSIIAFFATVFITVASCHGKQVQEQLDGQTDDKVQQKNHAEEKLSVQEFISWCANKDNKLSKSKEIADIRFDLSYMPTESMAFLELRTEQYEYPKFQEACNHYSDMTYFNFKIEVINGTGELLKYKLESPSQYEARVKYMSFEMQKDVY